MHRLVVIAMIVDCDEYESAAQRASDALRPIRPFLIDDEVMVNEAWPEGGPRAKNAVTVTTHHV